MNRGLTFRMVVDSLRLRAGVHRWHAARYSGDCTHRRESLVAAQELETAIRVLTQEHAQRRAEG